MEKPDITQEELQEISGAAERAKVWLKAYEEWEKGEMQKDPTIIINGINREVTKIIKQALKFSKT
jgi:hypothetical protein